MYNIILGAILNYMCRTLVTYCTILTILPNVYSCTLCKSVCQYVDKQMYLV